MHLYTQSVRRSAVRLRMTVAPWTTWIREVLHFSAWALILARHLALGILAITATVLLSISFERYRVSADRDGLMFRALWWRYLIPIRDIVGVTARPGYWKHDVVITHRDDPPWDLVVSQVDGEKFVMRGRKSAVNRMCTALEALTGRETERREV